ncbi:amidohydrolase, partial [Mycobacterium sp. E735]
MIDHADGTRTPLIDASVHIFFPSSKALRSVLREPFKSRGFPDYEMDWYGAPGGEYAPNTEGPDRQYPGSDPEFVAHELFSKRGVDVAVLHPMGRGIMPDRHLGSALHAAHNEMMVSDWLDSGEFGQRFRGTIRVNPDDIPGALREIEKYRAHPRVVQIGVQRAAQVPVGHDAAAHRVQDRHVDSALRKEFVGNGIMFPPTPSGNTRTYEQYVSFMALNYIYHQMNMIAEGVFERFDGLKFVWADGAADFITPF